jgi:hypothetical protein
MDQDFQDAIIDMLAKGLLLLQKKKKGLPSAPARVLLFNKTAAGSHLRRLFVHLIAGTGTCDTYATADDDPRYLAMLVKAMQDKAEETTAVAVADCAFHGHAAGEENCYRMKYRMSFYRF